MKVNYEKAFKVNSELKLNFDGHQDDKKYWQYDCDIDD